MCNAGVASLQRAPELPFAVCQRPYEGVSGSCSGYEEARMKLVGGGRLWLVVAGGEGVAASWQGRR